MRLRYGKKVLSIVLSGVLALSIMSQSAYAMTEKISVEKESSEEDKFEMRELSAFQIASDMGIGWNLGNSLEAEGGETNWGNPATTKAMIDKIKEKGFTTLRVPTRWDQHYTDGNYTIDSSYFDRVEEVVNYGLDNDMYVILNVHHNGLQTKVTTDTTVQNQVKSELAAIWTQIATRFNKYGDKLIFETNNEPRGMNGSEEDWTGNEAFYACVNEYNEAARAAIRSTGGNNLKRLIMMPTYCASPDMAKMTAWTKPASDDMIAVSLHAYRPFDFAFEADGHSNWQDSDEAELEELFESIHSVFLSNGIPVVMGEFGACNKNNTSARKTYASRYVTVARRFAEQNIPCVWWDNNAFNVGAENFGLFNRSSMTFTYGEIADALVTANQEEPVYETSTTGEKVIFSGSSSCEAFGQAVNFSGAVITNLGVDDTIYVSYSSANSPEMILQSFSVSDKGWVKINPDEVSDGIAKWKVSSLAAAYGDDFYGLDKVYIGGTGAALTVTKVYVPRCEAHVHNYTGTSEVTVAATTTTEGRKKIYCSVLGCTAYKVETIPPTTNSGEDNPTGEDEPGGEDDPSGEEDPTGEEKETVATPSINPVGGTYTTNQSITIRTSTQGADIYYTTDGSLPTASSIKYSQAISIKGEEGKSVTKTIKAIAVKSGMKDSAVSTSVYTIQLPKQLNSEDSGKDNNQGDKVDSGQNNNPENIQTPAVGAKISDEDTKAIYKVTQSGNEEGEVEYILSLDSENKIISVPSMVELDGVTYKVASIANEAFKSNKKITKVNIGSNVTKIGNKAFYKCTALTQITIPVSVKSIGKSAFYGCKKLKKVTIKTTKLTNKTVGSNAFKGIHAKATIKVPKKKLSSYKKLLKKKGIKGKKQKIKK